MGKQHETPEYRAARKRLTWVVARGDAWCMQGQPGTESSGSCLEPTRFIAPGTPWAVGHNDAGSVIIGPVHRRCNASEAATRGNLARKGIATTPTPPHRWVL